VTVAEGALFWASYRGLHSTPLPVSATSVVRVIAPIADIQSVLYSPARPGRLFVFTRADMVEIDIETQTTGTEGTGTGPQTGTRYSIRVPFPCIDARGAVWSMVGTDLCRYVWNGSSISSCDAPVSLTRLPSDAPAPSGSRSRSRYRYVDGESWVATTMAVVKNVCIDAAGLRIFNDYDPARRKDQVVRAIDLSRRAITTDTGTVPPSPAAHTAPRPLVFLCCASRDLLLKCKNDWVLD
jgi:hypothetical protein